MANWLRFELVDSASSLTLIAHTTPAWREVYVQILDQLTERHTGWWSANDWLTQYGIDPDSGSYPDKFRAFIPRELWGNHDLPGWTANGGEPWGL